MPPILLIDLVQSATVAMHPCLHKHGQAGHAALRSPYFCLGTSSCGDRGRGMGEAMGDVVGDSCQDSTLRLHMH